ncbi:MAG: glycosyltransferase family 9 protein, partial [Myxococcota bacterium]
HEIDLRLALLQPLPGDVLVREPCLPRQKPDSATNSEVPYVVLNLGARLAEKQLGTEEYAALAAAIPTSHSVVLSWGPNERAIADAVAARVDSARVAPPTDLRELQTVFQDAAAVVSCDTGPMHLSVALGVPTFGVFVATDPSRFGYDQSPHAVFDARNGPDGLVKAMCSWFEKERR